MPCDAGGGGQQHRLRHAPVRRRRRRPSWPGTLRGRGRRCRGRSGTRRARRRTAARRRRSGRWRRRRPSSANSTTRGSSLSMNHVGASQAGSTCMATRSSARRRRRPMRTRCRRTAPSPCTGSHGPLGHHGVPPMSPNRNSAILVSSYREVALVPGQGQYTGEKEAGEDMWTTGAPGAGAAGAAEAQVTSGRRADVRAPPAASASSPPATPPPSRWPSPSS